MMLRIFYHQLSHKISIEATTYEERKGKGACMQVFSDSLKLPPCANTVFVDLGAVDIFQFYITIFY